MWTQTLFPNLPCPCTTLLSGHHGGCVSGWHTYPWMDCIPNWTKWHFKNHIQHHDKEKNVWIWSGGYDIRPWLGWGPASWGYCQPMFFSFSFYYGISHKLGSFNDLQNLYCSQKWLASQLHSFCALLTGGGPAFYRGVLKIENSQKSADTFISFRGWTKGVAFVNGFNLGRFWPVCCFYSKVPFCHIQYIYNNEDSSNTVIRVPDSEIIMVICIFSFEFRNQGNVMKFIWTDALP